MPKVSVIVPVYNTEKYLAQCIDSILAQTFTDFELLLINDGSKDNSGKICDEYAANDSRVKVYHKENGGVSSARNVGLKESMGEWITFVDSDDWIECTALNTYVEAIQLYNPDIIKSGYILDYSNSDTDVVCCDNVYLISNHNDMYHMTDKTRYWAYTTNSIFKRELLQSLFFDEQIMWLEDHIFSLEYFLRCSTMLILPQAFYHYVLRDSGSLSNTKKAKDIFIASAKTYLLNLKLINISSNEDLNTAKKQYHFFNNTAVMSLYTYKGSYLYRKSVHESFEVLDKENMMPYEKIFSIHFLPFIFMDTILNLLFWIRRVVKKSL